MRTQAKLAEEIATLAAEVTELSRRRGRAMPTPADLVEVVFALGVSLEMLRAAREPGEEGEAGFAALFAVGEVTPGCEALKEAYLNAFARGCGQDRPGYESALRALRPILQEVLTGRAERWAQAWRDASWQSDLSSRDWLSGVKPPPTLAPGDVQAAAEWATRTVAKAKGWHLVLLAARALGLAQTELKAWREWVNGEAVKRHAFYLNERVAPHPSCSNDPADMWVRDVAQHTLPEEEEAELVRHGVVTAEALAAVKALPPVPPGREPAQ